MSDEIVWTYRYLVRVDPNDFGYAAVPAPYEDEIPEGHLLMLPPDFWAYLEDHPELVS